MPNNSSYRTLSSFKSDTTITFKPKVEENTIDLTDFVVPEAPNPLEETISQTVINNIDIPLTALNLGSNYTPVGN
jgi:hypothetical protein